MKTLAICSLKFSEKYDLKSFDFCGEKVNFALIDYPDIKELKELSDTQVMVKIIAFSCNYRDKSILLSLNKVCRENESTYMFSGFGSEFVGEVIKVGKLVNSLKKGDRVIADASYPFRENKNILPGLPSNFASQRFQIFEDEQLMKIPDSLPDEKAAAFTIIGHTVFSMIRKLELKKNDRVLITAASSNTSLAAIVALKGKGLRVFALTTNMDNENKFLELGVEKVIPYDALINNTIKDYLGKEKFEVAIDPFFDLHFCHLVEHLRFEARYITCGLFKQHSLFMYDKNNENNQYGPALITCMTRNIKFIGNCLGSKSDLRNAVREYVDGNFDIIIDSIFTGNDYIPFMEKTFNGKKRFGKIIYKY